MLLKAGERVRPCQSPVLIRYLEGVLKAEAFYMVDCDPIRDPITEHRDCENSGNSERFLNERGPKFN